MYQRYFDELQTVKAAVSKFALAKDVIDRQVQIVAEYNDVRRLLAVNCFYNPAELSQVAVMHGSILKESLQNLEQVQRLTSGVFKMNDAERLYGISKASDAMDSSFRQMKRLNNDILQVNEMRRQEKENIQKMKRLIQVP